MSGTVHAYVHPNHDSLSGLDVISTGQFETYFKSPVQKEWITLTHTPVLEEDFQFMPDFPANPSAYTGFFSSESQAHYIGFTVTDCPSGTFNFEACALFEITGQTIRGLTPTVSDTTGVSAVLNAATPQLAPQLNKMKDYSPLLNAGIDLVSAFVPEAQAAKMLTGAGNQILQMLTS